MNVIHNPVPNQTEPVVHVENVSKRYIFQQYRPSLRQEAVQMAQRLVGRMQQGNWESQAFWPLKDISFTLNRGDTLGIIGHNGAGKTTLLRLLSGIIEPTEGRIMVNGRFATLIGLGAGFDYERSGRENIFLNAAIQGVNPEEIEQRVHDIIEFSELGDFIDVRVKLYSSGMIARLGFSIAVHILPDVVFLDEVLSVGDTAFQEKSSERILELRERNTTLVFVSHSMSSIEKMCKRTIWLDHGQIKMDGPTQEVVKAYAGRYMKEKDSELENPLEVPAIADPASGSNG
jgi:ABC-type polysaccharide/polyol phosphate transport system ATPase subunit